MLLEYNTRLDGVIALTDDYLSTRGLYATKGIYKFIWVRSGSVPFEMDHQPMTLMKNDVISLSHIQHLDFKSVGGEYLILLFNNNFLLYIWQ